MYEYFVKKDSRGSRQDWIATLKYVSLWIHSLYLSCPLYPGSCLVLYCLILHTMAHDVHCTTLPLVIIYHCLLWSTFIMDLFKWHINPIHFSNPIFRTYWPCGHVAFSEIRSVQCIYISCDDLSVSSEMPRDIRKAFWEERTEIWKFCPCICPLRLTFGLALSQYSASDWLYLIDNSSQCKKKEEERRNYPKYICIFQNRSGTAHCLSLSCVNINC